MMRPDGEPANGAAEQNHRRPLVSRQANATISGGALMRRLTTVTVTAFALAALAACSGEEPGDSDPTPTATAPSLTPEEQAEQDAWEAVERYNDVYNEVRSDPGPDVNEKISGVATEPEDGYLVVLVDRQVSSGQVSTGESAVERLAANVRNSDEVVFDVCLDNRKVDVVDAQGNSVIPPDRPREIKTQYTVVRTSDGWKVSRVSSGEEDGGGAEPC